MTLTARSTDVDVRLEFQQLGETEWHPLGLSVEAEPGIISSAHVLVGGTGLRYRLAAYRASVAEPHRAENCWCAQLPPWFRESLHRVENST